MTSPNFTRPLTSVMTAGSFGRRASKSSTTLGRPRVMSFRFAVSRGIFTSTSPASTVCPSSTIRWEPEGISMRGPATFVNGSLYLRSIESWARVDIRPARSVAKLQEEATGVIPDSEFGRFVARVSTAEQTSGQIQQQSERTIDGNGIRECRGHIGVEKDHIPAALVYGIAGVLPRRNRRQVGARRCRGPCVPATAASRPVFGRSFCRPRRWRVPRLRSRRR